MPTTIVERSAQLVKQAIRSMDMVAIGRMVLTNREHIIALEPMENGLVGTLLRYPYEVRSEAEYFDEIPDVRITKDISRCAYKRLADASIALRICSKVGLSV
jgi:non-homologous end joining protein Ku